jgi:hypothetical protein
MVEIWRAIKDYEGIYEISSFGKVKSLCRFSPDGKLLREKIMKLRLDSNSNVVVGLTKTGRQKKFYVKNLVAESFVDKDHEHKYYVKHLDYNKKNNFFSNLKWINIHEAIAENITL